MKRCIASLPHACEPCSAGEGSACSLYQDAQPLRKRCCTRGAHGAAYSTQHQSSCPHKVQQPRLCPWELQREVTPRMHRILVSWLAEVSDELRLLPDTRALAVSLINRYMAVHMVLRCEFQLLGVACLWLAAKYDQARTPRASFFATMTNHTYSSSQVVDMERRVLAALNFEIGKPTTKAYFACLTTLPVFEASGATLIARHLLEIAAMPKACTCHGPAVHPRTPVPTERAQESHPSTNFGEPRTAGQSPEGMPRQANVQQAGSGARRRSSDTSASCSPSSHLMFAAASGSAETLYASPPLEVGAEATSRFPEAGAQLQRQVAMDPGVHAPIASVAKLHQHSFGGAAASAEARVTCGAAWRMHEGDDHSEERSLYVKRCSSCHIAAARPSHLAAAALSAGLSARQCHSLKLLVQLSHAVSGAPHYIAGLSQVLLHLGQEQETAAVVR